MVCWSSGFSGLMGINETDWPKRTLFDG